MKLIKTVLTLVLAVSFLNCASTEISNLDDARFALDKGDYTTAITKATNAVNADSTNIEAARVLASAYLGRSGVDYLELAQTVVDLSNNISNTVNSTNNPFTAFADALPTTITLSDLRSAIATLEALSGIDDATIADEGLADAVFDLALMQTIEMYAIGIYGSNYNTSLDATQITSTQSDAVQADMVAFDNRLIGSGLDSTESFLSDLRRTFCMLEPLSASAGFTLTEYQALVACQLSTSPATVNTSAIDAGIANCSVFDPSAAAVDTCAASNTSL